MTVTLRARRIHTPGGWVDGRLVLRDGVIVAVVPGPALPDPALPDPARSDPALADPDGTVVDIADDCVVLPGLVDSHVHVNEPGRTEWEGFTTATTAAAAGGVTTIADMPLNSIPATVDVASLEVKRAAAAGQLAVEVAFWGGAVPGNVGALRPLHDAGVVGFKCFLIESGVEEFPPLDPAGLRAAMRAIAAFDGVLIAHAEDPDVIARAAPPRGRRFADYLDSRPDAAEVTAVADLVAAARETGCRTHVVHVSSAASLPLLAAAKAEGLPVTAETCPHYLTLSAEDVPDGATQFKCCPPIRSAANRDGLWAGLADGTIDCVVSDHSPCLPAMKHLETGDFGEAWGGVASVQLSLPVVWSEARRRGHTLADLCGWMAAAPAALLGLPDRGTIRPGNRADLAILAPDEEFVVDRSALLYRHPISPYHGATLTGVVRQTWLGGAPVDTDARRGGLVDARRIGGQRIGGQRMNVA